MRNLLGMVAVGALVVGIAVPAHATTPTAPEYVGYGAMTLGGTPSACMVDTTWAPSSASESISPPGVAVASVATVTSTCTPASGVVQTTDITVWRDGNKAAYNSCSGSTCTVAIPPAAAPGQLQVLGNGFWTAPAGSTWFLLDPLECSASTTTPGVVTCQSWASGVG